MNYELIEMALVLIAFLLFDYVFGIRDYMFGDLIDVIKDIKRLLKSKENKS